MTSCERREKHHSAVKRTLSLLPLPGHASNPPRPSSVLAGDGIGRLQGTPGPAATSETKQRQTVGESVLDRSSAVLRDEHAGHRLGSLRGLCIALGCDDDRALHEDVPRARERLDVAQAGFLG